MMLGVLILGVIIFLVLRNNGHLHHGCCGHHGHGNDPLQILKMRLAKGEITVEEYEKMKQNLL